MLVEFTTFDTDGDLNQGVPQGPLFLNVDAISSVESVRRWWAEDLQLCEVTMLAGQQFYVLGTPTEIAEKMKCTSD